MQQLFYADEVRPPEEIAVDEADLKDSELQLALQLIAQTASADGFHPERYKDSVKQRVEEAIERKVAGQEIQVATPEPQGQVIDLMEALKKSVGRRLEAAPAPAPASAAHAAGGDEKHSRKAHPRAASRK
jgi:DNA end-binding protein Ku